MAPADIVCDNVGFSIAILSEEWVLSEFNAMVIMCGENLHEELRVNLSGNTPTRSLRPPCSIHMLLS